ncbi:MAG: hypothetical protein U9R37_05545 [Campylobacterota bacterium]|nr:hypothetical protein [Campylobacterota bacterium]
MKRILLTTILLSSFTFADDFKIAINTMNVQDCEGSSFGLAYKINEKLLVETSYAESYIRGVKVGSSDEKWNSYNTQRLGIRYYLKSYLQDEIKIFISAGFEYMYENTNLSTKEVPINSYGLLGMDFKIDDSFNVTFAFGSSGKGNDADKLETSPNYAHGFNSIMGIEYNF